MKNKIVSQVPILEKKVKCKFKCQVITAIIHLKLQSTYKGW